MLFTAVFFAIFLWSCSVGYCRDRPLVQLVPHVDHCFRNKELSHFTDL